MTLAGRRFAVDNKLALLRRETTAWRAECSGATSRFALHASQIAAVCADLDGMHDRIASELAKMEVQDATSLLRQERRILAALQIWDSYRAKWAVRVEPRMAGTLALLDDLAWRAYKPALHTIQHQQPERAFTFVPPLVFPSPRWSPFARAREQGYEIDEADGGWRVVEDFDTTLRCMPVPLIGVPWTQAAHLPEAVVVGHEVGHLVEEDLDLQEPLRLAIVAALGNGLAPERVAAWSEHWRSECFADVWGVLCCGPAFARIMATMLVDGDTVPERTQPDTAGRWSSYPPRPLRLALLAQCVRRLAGRRPATAFAAVSDALDRVVGNLIPLAPALKDFVADVRPVVDALLDAPWTTSAKGSAMGAACDVLVFNSSMQQQAEDDAERALARQNIRSTDVRVLFAALAWAFLEHPDAFRGPALQERFEVRIQQVRQRGSRDGPAIASPAALAERSARTVQAVFDRLDRHEHS